jgi:hypothetical protein
LKSDLPAVIITTGITLFFIYKAVGMWN